MSLDTFFIKTIDIHQLIEDDELHRKIRGLTISPGSGMNCALNMYQVMVKERKVNAKAIIADCGHYPIGWLLLTMEQDFMGFRPSFIAEYCAHIFVMSTWRRKNVGTSLFKQAQIEAQGKTIKVYSHENPAFFQPFLETGSALPIYT